MGITGIERSLAGFAVCLALAGTAAADGAAPEEPSRAELLEIIRKLERRVDELERKAAQTPPASPAPTAPVTPEQPATTPGPTGAPMDVGVPAAPASPTAPGTTVSALAEAVKKIAFSGYAEVLYSYNLRPGGEVAGVRGDALDYNQLRLPDSDADQFSFQNFEILADKALAESGSTGFRARVAYGRLGEIANVDPNTATGDALAVIDANFSWRTPCTPFSDAGHLDLAAGKFYTPLGLETLENADNFLVTRSAIFCFATPVTHTGIRATVPFSARAKANLFLVNGWDDVRAENDGKTVIANLVLAGSEKRDATVQLNVSYGTESTPGAHQGDKQRFLELIWDGTLGESTELAFDVVDGDTDTRRWRGAAAMLRQRIAPKTTLAGRIGWYGDDILAAERTRLVDLSLALAWEAAAGLILSLEVRHDASDNDVYLDGSGNPTDHQDTLTASFLYRF